MTLVATKRPLLERVAKATGSVEIVPRKPLALVDRRLYNYLLASDYQDWARSPNTLSACRRSASSLPRREVVKRTQTTGASRNRSPG
jgi:hypothetical protein